MKVLIAKFSELMYQRLDEMLSELDSIDLVSSTGSLERIHETVQQTRPDVLIMGIHLPDSNDLREFSEIKATPVGPVIILLVTCPASQYQQYRRRCLSVGADYIINTAAGIEGIVEVLEELVKIIDLDLCNGGKCDES